MKDSRGMKVVVGAVISHGGGGCRCECSQGDAHVWTPQHPDHRKKPRAGDAKHPIHPPVGCSTPSIPSRSGAALLRGEPLIVTVREEKSRGEAEPEKKQPC